MVPRQSGVSVSMGKVNNARVRYCDDETLAKIFRTVPNALIPG